MEIKPTHYRKGPGQPNRRRVRLLLINPRFPESFWSFRWSVEKVLPNKRAVNPPLGLATLAALCPSHWEITIIDENIEPVPLQPQADIVGICGMGAQFKRQRELLDYYRKQGFYVLAGGSYASLCPEEYGALADTVIAGEAEYIWQDFCRDYEQGATRARYQETGVVKLEDSPAPRFDLLKLDKYTTVSMQFSRGCPYRCEFCDIIVMFGRRPRTKTLEQIGWELDQLRSLNIHNIFFVDDNLIGNKKAAKQLLHYLVDYQNKHRYTFAFGTEVSLNLAADKELLRLFRAANFAWVFIGIESPDKKSLEETKKSQNMRQDILESVHTIYAYGIDVLAGFIIGFDNDTMDAFDKQYHFITASGIQVAMVGLLTALPKTPLYERLQREGRLIPEAQGNDNTKPGTNFIPLRMGYDDMVHGYQKLYRSLFNDRNIARRIRNKSRYLRHPIYQGGYSFADSLEILGKLFSRGLLAGGPIRLYRFLRTLATASLQAWPQVIMDWIAGLAMRDYIKRHFNSDTFRARKLTKATEGVMRRLCAAGVRRGALEVNARTVNGRANLRVMLRGYMDRAFYGKAARRLEKMLRRTTTTLTLYIDELCEEQRHQLDRLLRRLAPYGDRVSIWVSKQVQPLLSIDSSVFHLLMDETTAQTRV